MNEHELSNLLHEAAGDATVSSTASRRVLRRTRLRMAMTGGIALSLIALLVGGGFAFATRETLSPQPNLKPAGPVVTPDPQNDLPFTEANEVFLAEVEESDSLWTFTAQDHNDELCLNSTTYTRTEIGDRVHPSGFGAASGTGDCVPLGVPGNRHLGFYMWDSGKDQRLEVLGALATDVARLELQESNNSDDVVTTIQAPDELGDDRNFFYLWLPLNEVGILVAYDEAGNVLQESELCLEPRAQDASCTVGDESTTAGPTEATGPAVTNAEYDRLACRNPWFGVIAKVEPQATPEETVQAWLVERNIPVDIADFESEKRNSDVWSLSLPAEGGTSIAAVLSRERDRWALAEVLYCPRLVDPNHRGMWEVLPPPPDPPTDLPSAPPSPSP